MKRSLLSLLARAAALSALVALAGCGVLGGKDTDETQGWSAQKLYGEAKDAMNAKTWDKAIKHLEKLEARYPYGRFAQQSQLDVAYCYWKNNERASALAAADRFIKLYPNHEYVDYVYYLKGLVNFNENVSMFAFLTSPDMTDRDGHTVHAVFGFARFLCDLLERAKPRLIAVAFDESLETSFRNRIDPSYKANREPAPEELKRQFGRCREFCDLLGVPQFASGEYEADDIIGTLHSRLDRKSTRLNSSHVALSRMPSSA